MEFYEVVEKRRSVRSFTKDSVPEETIQRILNAGLKAPTYNHLREWDFILIKDLQTRLNIVKVEGIPDSVDFTGLENMFHDSDMIMKHMYLDAIPKQKSMLIRAPELLVVVFKPKTRVDASRRIYDLNCLASVWCCIENILLAMAAEDLYGVTYIPQKTCEIRNLLSIPEELEIAAIIPFGHKDLSAHSIPQKPVSLEDKLHINNW